MNNLKTRDGLCLILEGGGAKCAYQNGALAVLEKAGFRFSGVGGTSFGALNAAMYIAGGLPKLNEFWSNLSPANMFKEPKLNQVFEGLHQKTNFVDEELVELIKAQSEDFEALFTDVSNNYHKYVFENVDEQAVRRSGIDFGLVTLAIPSLGKALGKGVVHLLNPLAPVLDTIQIVKTVKGMFNDEERKAFLAKFKNKPVELVNEEIPKGKLADFVSASASIPPFYPVKIGNTYYTDGGDYDNMPISVMKRFGYRKFIVIRTNTYEIRTNPDEEGLSKKEIEQAKKFKNLLSDIEVEFITPSRPLGSCAMFAESNIKELRILGIMDTVNFLDKLYAGSSGWKETRKLISKKLLTE